MCQLYFLSALVYLNAFYVNDGSQEESTFLEYIANNLPDGTKTAITPIPLEYLAYDGMMVEIEGYAMRSQNGGKLAREYAPETAPQFRPESFCTALRCEKMIFVSAQSAIDTQGVLMAKNNIVEQSRILSNNIQSALNPGNLSAQTHQAMAHIKTILNELGADYDGVCNIMTVYKGDCGADALYENRPYALRTSATRDPQRQVFHYRFWLTRICVSKSIYTRWQTRINPES